MRGYSHRGMVLVFSLWVLGILTILAVSIAAGIRQKIFLVARLDDRSRMAYLLQSSVKKTAAFIHQQMEVSAFTYTPQVKMNLHNNIHELSQISLGHDDASVVMPLLENSSSVRYGVVDEESKINLNKTDLVVLANLLIHVLNLKDEEANRLAAALLDWRQYGESEVTGFFSEDYYSNLQYPYPKKSADYETLDEILLVKGMTKPYYDTLVHYLTIWGDGAVNINTASREVLIALGLEQGLVDKILNVRHGRDGIEATGDDHVFSKTFEIAIEVNAMIQLTPLEMRAIDALNMRGQLCSNSYYFTIEAWGKLSGMASPQGVRAVYSSREDKIIYWKER
ncbi:MAG: general secretion pathway protein GspK [Candidatus Omnitrophica bacterium]|nr:general secretion pathway protein GspK [Candidatus Omnitrophota bacterium]